MGSDEKGIVLRGQTDIVEVEAEFEPAPEASAGVVQQEQAVPSATAPAPEASAGFGGVSSVHQPGMSAHELASALAYVVQALPKSKDDPLLRRIYLAVEAQPGAGGRRLALVAHDTYRAHAAYVRLPDGVHVTAQSGSGSSARPP